MLIRNAREADFNVCVDIARKAWPQFHERESIYHLFCKFFNTTSFVCQEGDEILAFLLGFVSQVDKRQAYIHLVAVAPQFQRRGIAEQLYERFFEAVEPLGVNQVRLIVNTDNPRSLAFHEKMGFVRDLHGEIIEVDGHAAVKDYNGPGLHMIPFSRNL